MRKQFYMLSLAIISLCMLAFSTTALAEEKDKSAPKKKSGKPAFAKKKIVTISGALGFDSDTNTPFDDKLACAHHKCALLRPLPTSLPRTSVAWPSVACLMHKLATVRHVPALTGD